MTTAELQNMAFDSALMVEPHKIAVEFMDMDGGAVELTIEEAKQILALVSCDPFRLMFEKFLKPLETQAIEGLRNGDFFNEPPAENAAHQNAVRMQFEISELKNRLTEQISLAEMRKTI